MNFKRKLINHTNKADSDIVSELFQMLSKGILSVRNQCDSSIHRVENIVLEGENIYLCFANDLYDTCVLAKQLSSNRITYWLN